MKFRLLKPLLVSGLLVCSAWTGALAQTSAPYANATVAGALLPGVYGRIEIGTAPPPLIYPQPVIIYPAPRVVQQPLYLHVPPGHAKKWSKHCSKYNACGQPVYFVRVDGDDDYERARYVEYREKKEKKEKHHGKGNGKHDD
jgi:hypothetical protein